MLPAAGCRASSLRVVLLWVDSAGILIMGRRGDHHDQRRARPDAGPRWGRGHYSEDGGSWWDETSRRWFLNRHAGHPGDPLRVRSLRPPAAQRLAGRRSPCHLPLEGDAAGDCGGPGEPGQADEGLPTMRISVRTALILSYPPRFAVGGHAGATVAASKMLAWPSTCGLAHPRSPAAPARTGLVGTQPGGPCCNRQMDSTGGPNRARMPPRWFCWTASLPITDA
jgi:hypothetical protein